MKYKEILYGKLVIFLALLGMQLTTIAQTQKAHIGYTDPYLQAIDTHKIVHVIYPSLTQREGNSLLIPIPPNEHPRLYFRKADVLGLKKKLSHPLMAGCWDSIHKFAAVATVGKLQQNVPHNIDFRVLSTIESKAFLCAFEKNNILGKEAVTAIKNVNNTIIINYNKADVCRDIGKVIHSTAIVYDWCYALISEVEKKTLIQQMESLATKLEVIWPKLVQGSVVGHGVEEQLSKDMLACGIATYNEKPQIYNLVAGRILAEFVPVRNFFYPASYHHQGSAYGPGRFRSDLYFTLLFAKMGYPNIVSKSQAKVPYKWLYTRRPDGQLLRDGDDYNEMFIHFGQYWDIRSDALTASYYKDPILMAEAIKEKQIGKDPLYDFLLTDPSIAGNSNSTSLSLSKYFAAPLGSMVARTGWENNISSSNVVAEMKIGVHSFVNHQHLDAGSFQLYYKGPLAVNSGIYQGTTGAYGSEHFINYYQRSIAHNTMLIYDPNEHFTWHDKAVGNDGGQHYPNDGAEPKNLQQLLSKNYETGEVLAHAFGPDPLKPDYTYIKGELAKAYGSKVKSFKRSFVFLNLMDEKIPAALIVFDRVVASDKNYKKTWLLHCVEEPVIAANITTVTRTEKGYNGQLVNTTLLPSIENLGINKVGGKDNEYRVNGTNFTQHHFNTDNSADSAVWRIEVSPKNANTNDNFLNVLQVMDYNGGNNQPLMAQKIETDQFVGTAIGNRMVLFNKNSEVSGGVIQLKITADGIIKVLITDLANGNWTVQSLDNLQNTLQKISNKNGLLYFNATKGNYTITKNN